MAPHVLDTSLFLISGNVCCATLPWTVLTGFLSWDLESPYLFDQFEIACDVGWVRRARQLSISGAKVVALRLHRRQSDGTMNKLNIILIFLLFKCRFSQH